MSPEERRLLVKLFAGSDTLTLSGSPSERLRKALKDFRSALRTRLESEYFLTNRKWFAGGVGISLLGFAILA